MNFWQTVVAIVVGWGLGTASTWLVFIKPWLDRRMLKKPVVTPAVNNQIGQTQQGPIKIV